MTAWSRKEVIGSCELYLGNCLDILPMLDADSFDSCVCDPPYGLTAKRPGGRSDATRGAVMGGFMGMKWDSDVPSVDIWREVYRVLKPGAHLLAFFGTRTYHRGVINIEDAGFEIRDQVQWLYGSGFPKSHDVSKAIDKTAGAEREAIKVVDPRSTFDGRERSSAAINNNWRHAEGREDVRDLSKKVVTAPATAEAAQWEGWGTALKPAHEPIVVARKPLIGTVAENVLAHGVGGLNIDGCRVGDFVNTTPPGTDRYNQANFEQGYRPSAYGREGEASAERRYTDRGSTNFAATPGPRGGAPEGRWPANVIHDGSDEVLAAFPAQSSVTGKRSARSREAEVAGTNWLAANHKSTEYTDSGSPARFFYCAKSSKSDRDDGLAEFRPNHTEKAEQGEDGNPYGRWKPLKNNHPTVKPTDLMRYLCRLVTPPGGKVLDPFAGSGSTGRGAVLEGFQFIGIEIDEGYFDIACKRIEQAYRQPDLFVGAARVPQGEQPELFGSTA